MFLLVGENVFEMNATGCRSPFTSVWVRTAPDAYFEASASIWKGHEWSGMVRTGSSVNLFFSSSKDR